MPMGCLEVCEIDGEDNVKTTSVDIDQNQVKEFKIGDEVEITIRGLVGMLEIPPHMFGKGEEGEEAQKERSTMGLRVASRTIRKLDNEQVRGIMALASEEDDED